MNVWSPQRYFRFIPAAHLIFEFFIYFRVHEYSLLDGCGLQINITYSTSKECEANKSHWLIIDVTKIYKQIW